MDITPQMPTLAFEAESAAFCVCAYFNLDTGANSFGYISEYSRGRELKELNASLDTIRKTAAEMIDAINGRFQEIAKERDIAFAIGEQQAEPSEPKVEETAENTEVINLVENKLYEKFAELFPQFTRGDYSYMRLEAGAGFMPLSLEYIFGDRISVMHTYELNGDLCYDPMMEFRFNTKSKTMSAIAFEQSMPPLYQYFDDDGVGINVDGNGKTRIMKDLGRQLNEFAAQWFDNIGEQGYVPVRATMELDENGNISKEGLITDKTVEITFDADGNPIIPETEKSFKEYDLGYASNKITELDLSLPDPSISFSEMNLYGYASDDMLPLTNGRAVELFDADHCVYLLYADNTEAMVLDRDEIRANDGLCGIEREDWEHSPVRAAQLAIAANAESKREAELLYKGYPFGFNPYIPENKFGIYQIRENIDEARNFRFAFMKEMEAHGLTVDRANYELVYVAPFSERVEALSDRYPVLNRIYSDFNSNHPADYTGRSVSVSDIIVLKCNGDISSHFVDSAGFVELTSFLGEERTQLPEKPAEIGASETLSQVGTRLEEQQSGKPTLMERLEANRQKAELQGQNGANKGDKQECRE